MNKEEILKPIRNSNMFIGEVYFWTNTIKDWKHLLKQDKYKELIIDTLRRLIEKKLIKIYAFVIMPNHLHFVWEMNAKNGKEMPYASCNKNTGHEILKDLKKNHISVLPFFEVKERERSYRVWQRDPLAVLMDTKVKLRTKDRLHTLQSTPSTLEFSRKSNGL
jgi:REP element-mobilizing transposase RayT